MYYYVIFCSVRPKKSYYQKLNSVSWGAFELGVRGSNPGLFLPRFCFHFLKMFSYSTRLKINSVLDRELRNSTRISKKCRLLSSFHKESDSSLCRKWHFYFLGFLSSRSTTELIFSLVEYENNFKK